MEENEIKTEEAPEIAPEASVEATPDSVEAVPEVESVVAPVDQATFEGATPTAE